MGWVTQSFLQLLVEGGKAALWTRQTFHSIFGVIPTPTTLLLAGFVACRQVANHLLFPGSQDGTSSSTMISNLQSVNSGLWT